jgi:hypothetical protein
MWKAYREFNDPQEHRFMALMPVASSATPLISSRYSSSVIIEAQVPGHQEPCFFHHEHRQHLQHHRLTW